MDLMEDRSEIAFFDVETTIPSRSGQGFALLEFGAILVCPRKLVELHSYSTLVRPADLSAVSVASVRCNGITRDAVSSAPTFCEIADRVYDILHGRVWAGHNIVRFDCARIREAFANIGRSPPEPKGTIDSLALLTQRFGRRAGDMKMATLATYFGLGKQTHRSLDDVRMNLEVLKYCATVLFLESSLPDILTNISVSPTTRSRSNGKAFPGGRSSNTNSPASVLMFTDNQAVSPLNVNIEVEPLNPLENNIAKPDPFNMSLLIDQVTATPLQQDATMEERSHFESPKTSSNAIPSEGCSGYAGFLEPDEVALTFVRASFVQSYRGTKRIQLLHKDVFLQLCCSKLRVRFGVSTKFFDHAGRPRLSIVLDPSPSLCKVLDNCDYLAQKLFVESGSSSEWRPVVIRKSGFLNSSTIRLHIPTVTNGDIAIYSTEIYQKETSGNPQRLVFSRFDATELDSLFTPGTLVDAFFSLDVYDYQQFAGMSKILGASVGCQQRFPLSGAQVNVRRGKGELQVVVVGGSNSKWQCNASTNFNSQSSVKNQSKLSTFSSKIATDMPLYEPPGVSFDQYLNDQARVFEAIFPDKRRSQRLNEEEWRIQMLPIQFLFLTVWPVVDMKLRCKTQGKDYPPGVPGDTTKVLELDITKWELQGLDTVLEPSHFTLGVRGALYPDRRGIRSRLKGQLEMSISFVLPPMLAVVPEDALSGVAEAVLNRLVENMKHKVNGSLLADFNEFKKEKLKRIG
ncbi:Exonuclease [Macleaya cordata]|uniref:Exonuclease n=1 Tax=Macleaya cordata TaxID=56857 RepID=A0A200QEP4_MACCD|nr:Exonuclease [Macleaya cordata]